MSEPYAVAFSDHPVANVRQADVIRTALQVLPGVTRLGYPSPDFVIATTAGPLTLSVYPHLTGPGVLFAGRFLDKARAAKHLGSTWGLHRLNPLSGKWNHDHDVTSDAPSILRSFLSQLLPILPLHRLVTHLYQDHDRSQIRAAFQGTEWTATIDCMGGPRFVQAGSLFRLEPRPKDHPLRFSAFVQDRAELAHDLTMSMLCDVQAVLLRDALQSLPSCLETLS